MDIVRVIRVIEYIGPRDAIEEQLSKSIMGDKFIKTTGVLIRTATIGQFPEIFPKEQYEPLE
jgi:hypothetical protein